MVYKMQTYTRSTDVESVLTDTNNDSLFPKVVFFTDETQQFIYDSTEQDTYESGRDPQTEASIIYPDSDSGLVFGDDYGTLIFTSDEENLVFYVSLPAPTISESGSGLNGEDAPYLSWDSSYKLTSTIFRTATYTTGDTAPAEYTQVAQVPGYTTSQGEVTYTDSVITLASGESIDYFVQNENGTSNIFTISKA